MSHMCLTCLTCPGLGGIKFITRGLLAKLNRVGSSGGKTDVEKSDDCSYQAEKRIMTDQIIVHTTACKKLTGFANQSSPSTANNASLSQTTAPARIPPHLYHIITTCFYYNHVFVTTPSPLFSPASPRGAVCPLCASLCRLCPLCGIISAAT
eukprot:9025238-Pyramimonas_sp.AAC.1